MADFGVGPIVIFPHDGPSLYGYATALRILCQPTQRSPLGTKRSQARWLQYWSSRPSSWTRAHHWPLPRAIETHHHWTLIQITVSHFVHWPSFAADWQIDAVWACPLNGIHGNERQEVMTRQFGVGKETYDLRWESIVKETNKMKQQNYQITTLITWWRSAK